MKHFTFNAVVLSAVVLTAVSAVSCRDTVQSGRRTVPFVEDVIRQEGPAFSLVSGFDPKDSKGTIAIIGPESRNAVLSVRFLEGDCFDNIDGSRNPDQLPDFSGEVIDFIDDMSFAYDSLYASDQTALRTHTVKNFLAALDTSFSLGSFDSERLRSREASKMVVFSSPFSALCGAFDVDTLCIAGGKNIPVVYPSRAAFDEQFAREIAHEHIVVVTDSATAVSGVYPRLFDEMAKERGVLGCGCIAVALDSTASFPSLINRYKAAGGNMPFSAVLVDDPEVSVSALAESLDEVLTVQTGANLNRRKLLTDDITIVDMNKYATDVCYSILRNNNIFTHNISYPVAGCYKIVNADDGDGQRLVEKD